MDYQNYCLKWKRQMEHFQNALAGYIDRQIFCDVTLASEGEVFNAHQFVLSACSPYFENIFNNLPTNKHPVIFLNDVSSLEVKILFDYMYKGQAVVSKGLLPTFLKTCERLQIQGLCTDKRLENTSTTPLKNNLQVTATNVNIPEPSPVIENNPIVSESDDSSNQKLCYNKKRKTNALEQDSVDNVQPTCNSRQSSSPTNTAVAQTLLKISVPESHPTKRNCLPRKETEHIHATSARKRLFAQEKLLPSPAQIGHSKNQLNNTSVNTDQVRSSDEEITQGNEATQLNMPDIMINNENNDLNRSDVLTSPPYSQESFIFTADNLKNELPPANLSSKSVIIQDVEQDIIEISDDGNDTISNDQSEGNIGFQTSIPGNKHVIGDCADPESMIVQVDKNSQKHTPEVHSEDPSERLDENLDHDSDDSEIVLRRKNTRLYKNCSSSDDAFKLRTLTRSRIGAPRDKQRTNNTVKGTSRTTSENLKTEALTRAKGLKVMIKRK